MIAIYVAVALGALAVGAGLVMRRLIDRPLFAPGTVAARISAQGESLDPPAQADPGFWQVTPAIRLRHTSVGRGRDVVVVHGGPAIPSTPWRVADLTAQDLRWHFYDQRGCGGSTRPITRAGEGNTWKAMQDVESRLGLAEQLADLERIRRILGRERLLLVGHSFGALIAALYAAEWPERVSGLVLVSPAPLLTMPTEGDDLFALVRARLDSRSQAELDEDVKQYFDFRALLGRDEASLSRLFGGFGRYFARATGAAELGTTDAQSAPGGFATVGLYLSLGRRHDWTPWIRRVRARVVVLHGAADIQPRAASERVAHALPDARFVEVAGAGHFMYDERPEEVAKVMQLAFEEIPE